MFVGFGVMLGVGGIGVLVGAGAGVSGGPLGKEQRFKPGSQNDGGTQLTAVVGVGRITPVVGVEVKKRIPAGLRVRVGVGTNNAVAVLPACAVNKRLCTSGDAVAGCGVFVGIGVFVLGGAAVNEAIRAELPGLSARN